MPIGSFNFWYYINNYLFAWLPDRFHLIAIGFLILGVISFLVALIQHLLALRR